MSLIVLEIVEPGIDGVFRHVEGLITHLRLRSISVHLAYSSRRASASLWKLVESVHESGGETLDLQTGNEPSLEDWAGLIKLYRLAQRVKPDVIHCHSSKAGALGRALYYMGISSQYFYTPNAYFGMAREGGFVTSIYNGIESWLGAIGRTINISDDEARFGREVLGIKTEKQIIIFNPVDVLRFCPPTAGQRINARSQFGLPDSALVIGTAARMSWQKDPKSLYQALDRVLSLHPDLYFLHVSSGGEIASEIQARISRAGWRERVKISPYLDDPLVFYQALDGFVLTSRYEAGVPFVVVEAMAMNLPMACTEYVGGSILTKLGLNGLYSASAGNVDSLCEQLKGLLMHIHAKRGCNHREIAEQKFSQLVCYDQVIDLYRHPFSHSLQSS